MTWLGALASFVLVGSACSEQVQRIIEECETPGAFDISGEFEERYNCEQGGECVDRDVTIYLHIERDMTDTDESDGTDYTFCETAGIGPLCVPVDLDQPDTLKFSGQGTLCGNVYAWNGVAPGAFTETGIWTFSNGGDTFLKNSAYQNAAGGGVCEGAARRGGGADEPPTFGACR
jgi:hypothetical protein